ncbi:MAG: LysR substrate-binding domain-containing protein [Brotaphodocola sp.]
MLMERLGLTLTITSYAYSEDAIARLVEHGLGISIVAHTDSLDLYRIRILTPAWLTESRDIYLTWHQYRHPGDAVQEMKHFILAQSQAHRPPHAAR